MVDHPYFVNAGWLAGISTVGAAAGVNVIGAPLGIARYGTAPSRTVEVVDRSPCVTFAPCHPAGVCVSSVSGRPYSVQSRSDWQSK